MALERKPQKKLLGDLLVDAGLITSQQLEDALKLQKKIGERLGKVLVDLGFVSEQDIIEILEQQLKISKISLKNVVIGQPLLELVPKAMITRHRVMPIKREKNRLTVAMVDPLNLVAMDDLRLTTGCEIFPVIATEKELTALIHKSLGIADFSEKNKQGIEVVSGFGVEGDNDDEETELGEEAPVVRVVNSFIHQAIKDKVSDIHIEPHQDNVKIRFRTDGILSDYMNLPRKILPSLVSRVKIMASMDIAEKRVPQDGRIQIKMGGRHVDLRVSTLPTIFGEKIVIRILDKSTLILRLDQLGFGSANLKRFEKAIGQTYGMILITGPTGSGKTTTLYAALSQISTPEKNIITVEDPVEYILEEVNQIQVNTKAGLNFATGLRSILRQDPDIIMVGEIRDSETADIAVRSATTGHMVLSTLHTNDAAGAITRLIDMGTEPFLVASSVIEVVAQRLVRVICPRCKTNYKLASDSPMRVALNLPSEAEITLYKGIGCEFCNHTGYKGRAGVHEVMSISAGIRCLITLKATSEEIKLQAVQEGMITLREDAFEKAKRGITSIEEVLRVASTE